MTSAINVAVVRKVLRTVDAGLVSGLGEPKLGQMCVEAAVCYALGLPHGDNPDCVSRALRAFKIKLNDTLWSSTEARAKGLRRLALAQLGSAGVLDDKEFVRRIAELAIRRAVPEALRAAASMQKDSHKAAALRDAADHCEKEGTRESALNARKVANANANADTYTAAADTYTAAANAANAAANAANAAANAANAAANAANAAANAYIAAANANANANAANAAVYAANAAANAADNAYIAAAYAARDKSLASFAEAAVQILIDMKAPGCQWLYLTSTGEMG